MSTVIKNLRKIPEVFQLFCVFDCLGFANHIDLDLTGVFQLSLDLLGNVTGQKVRTFQLSS